ncbi:hypothetical protein DFR50_15628 [Roseiarcus fermentans]|uniref:Pentapeptide MXKDX repeat protein n=1 Tax=Roseiarcus fermentans TaxID=1473586 RepID=A0A366EHW2_9HYPH|nr:hypothetical protein [Roseiarcus fermentans]RBP02031.1 hypothetical protein DFR50_15628 [Roseiarcus fermentans]
MLKLTTSLAIALAAFAAVPALADDMMMKDGTMVMMQPDGHVTTMTPSADQMKMAQDAMMKHGTEMKAPVMMMMHDGHMMMMNDMKMDDGKMASDHMMMMK